MRISSIHIINNNLVGKINNEMVELNLPKDITANLKRFASDTTSNCVVNFSSEKEEENLLIKDDKHYYFAFLNETFKVFDKKQKRFRKVRYCFEYPEDETAFKDLAKAGSFVLGLSRYMVDMYFYCEDVFKGEE